jgi:hypothetical protein
MRQTLKQPCWFSLSSASQSGIPILENPLKLIARTQEIINLLLDLFEFVFRNGSNPVARNISTITHSQDGRQLSEREAHLQRTLDQSNAVKGVCRVISITAVGAGAVSAELPVVRSAAECRCLSRLDVTVHRIARFSPSTLSINPGIGSRVKHIRRSVAIWPIRIRRGASSRPRLSARQRLAS